jgi:hypothetical protein
MRLIPVLRSAVVAWLVLGAGFLANVSVVAVPPSDLTTIKPSDFADEELDLPYYLAHFHRLANSIPLEGELRGWITASLWRGNSNQHTYNARVLENHLSLAYFYCTKRPWNSYYAHPAVRMRLEAVLERWCNMQSPDGKFSEYAEGRWGLAPTAFATKFMGETLRLLAKGPPIDVALHERLKAAQRKAILITLRDPALWDHGRKYANQFSNVYAGGLAWLALFPRDMEVRGELMKRMRQAAAELQSPAGYFYEREGPDWGYSLSTHHSNLHVAWHYARRTAFEPLVVNEVRRFYEWLSWNAVIEPDGTGFVLNRAIETRQRRPWIAVAEGAQARNFSGVPQAQVVPPARAFTPSREQEKATRKRLRAALEAAWPDLPQLEEGNFRGYTPYAFLHRDLVQWLPTAKQQAAAQSRLPYLHEGRYAHLRTDDRRGVSFLYVRRPNYYAAFNAGEQINEQQRYGLGLLWSPRLGTLAQTQTGSGQDVWGTMNEGASGPYEAGAVAATIDVNGRIVARPRGPRDLGKELVTVSYPLGSRGHKTIRFDDHGIVVQTKHSGNFFESVPLLTREGDQVRVEENRILLDRGGKPALAIEFDPGADAEVLRAPGSVGPYRVSTARIKGTGTLSYRVRIPSPAGRL